MDWAELLTEIQGMQSCSWIFSLIKSLQEVVRKILLLSAEISDQVLRDLAVLSWTSFICLYFVFASDQAEELLEQVLWALMN